MCVLLNIRNGDSIIHRHKFMSQKTSILFKRTVETPDHVFWGYVIEIRIVTTGYWGDFKEWRWWIMTFLALNFYNMVAIYIIFQIIFSWYFTSSVFTINETNKIRNKTLGCGERTCYLFQANIMERTQSRLRGKANLILLHEFILKLKTMEKSRK